MLTEIAQREAAKLVYGTHKSHAREPEYATIAAVTRQDYLSGIRIRFTPITLFVRPDPISADGSSPA